MPKTDQERAWEYYNAADSLYAQRFAYFMVAQAMLIAGFSTLYATSVTQPQLGLIKGAIAVLGFLFAVIQYRVSRSLDKTMNNVLDEVKTDKVFENYLGKKEGDCFSVTSLQSCVIPAALGVFWIVVGIKPLWTLGVRVLSLPGQ
jgi:hypothetical protein